MSKKIGKLFTFTSFGESHGKGIGGIIDGCPAGIELDEEFIQQGIHHFSLNKFIESLNMSKGQFYYYFKTKEELIYEVIKLKSQKILEHTAQQTKLGKTFHY